MSPRFLFLSAAAIAAFGAMPAAAQPAVRNAPTAGAQGTPAIETTGSTQPAVRNAPSEAEQAAPIANDVATPTIEEVREGNRVFDTHGAVVGTIESTDENGAIVSTGRARARLPFTSFGRNARGLVITMTRAQLEAAVAARSPS